MRQPRIDEHFEQGLDPRWTVTCPGGGRLLLAESVLRFSFEGASAGVYTDAQIDDYSGLPPSRFPWKPPLRMEVRARASHRAASDEVGGDGAGEAAYLRGTAGFGFWNYPFSLSGALLRLPDAIWFFAASPPSKMALVPGMPGYGWKAQVIHAHRWQSFAAALPGSAAIGVARLTGEERAAARWVQRISGAHEALLPARNLNEWHCYALDWRREVARFSVDDVAVLSVPNPPAGPLGFVAWIDNQYAVATPRGHFSFGTLTCGPQALELDMLRILPQ